MRRERTHIIMVWACDEKGGDHIIMVWACDEKGGDPHYHGMGM